MVRWRGGDYLPYRIDRETWRGGRNFPDGSRSVVLALLWGPWTARAATQPQIVRTPALEIVDAGGRTRATLDAVNGKPSLWLYGDDGGRRAGLTVGTGSVPELALLDPQGRQRILLRVGFERAAEIRIADGRGRPRLGLWVGYDDAPGVWLFDDLARPRIGMKVLTGGVPR
ncbi:MAG: hypothetical protein E6G99_02915, partial [Bacillati bacterium ANGP1]